MCGEGAIIGLMQANEQGSTHKWDDGLRIIDVLLPPKLHSSSTIPDFLSLCRSLSACYTASTEEGRKRGCAAFNNVGPAPFLCPVQGTCGPKGGIPLHTPSIPPTDGVDVDFLRVLYPTFMYLLGVCFPCEEALVTGPLVNRPT